MTLTYIFHSGFALETTEQRAETELARSLPSRDGVRRSQTTGAILIFDYWMDPAGVIPKLLQLDKPMYVFVSHFHEDHFSRSIFEWRKVKPNITYILSKDILKRRRASKEEADAWLSKGGSWSDERISVHATGSNDSGVSWVIETEGKTIFHAGDLNNWYARFLSDDTPDAIIETEEFGAINPVYEEKRYLGELKDIRKLTDHFDLVMFPVDGRIGNGYTLGGRQFLERFKVGMFVPMHFVVSGFESAHRFKAFADEKDVAFWEIMHDGEQIEL